jgi:hypothetical protein
MAERAPFLNQAYSAHHHRERPADDVVAATVKARSVMT